MAGESIIHGVPSRKNRIKAICYLTFSMISFVTHEQFCITGTLCQFTLFDECISLKQNQTGYVSLLVPDIENETFVYNRKQK